MYRNSDIGGSTSPSLEASAAPGPGRPGRRPGRWPPAAPGGTGRRPAGAGAAGDAGSRPRCSPMRIAEVFFGGGLIFFFKTQNWDPTGFFFLKTINCSI